MYYKARKRTSVVRCMFNCSLLQQIKYNLVKRLFPVVVVNKSSSIKNYISGNKEENSWSHTMPFTIPCTFWYKNHFAALSHTMYLYLSLLDMPVGCMTLFPGCLLLQSNQCLHWEVQGCCNFLSSLDCRLHRIMSRQTTASIRHILQGLRREIKPHETLQNRIQPFVREHDFIVQGKITTM